MKIAIQGHSTRGKEVIQILESLGGKNTVGLTGTFKTFYYIDNKNEISDAHKDKFPSTYKFYTLEEFEKEFPFKIGNKVVWDKDNYTAVRTVLRIDYSDLAGIKYAITAFGAENCFWEVDVNELKLCKEMNEERNITLTLDKAKEWYNKGGDLKQVALQAFSEEELNPLPRSWEEFATNYARMGYYISSDGKPLMCASSGKLSSPHVCPSKKSAEAHLAMIQLEQLRNCWRQGWKPKLNSTGFAIIKYPIDYVIAKHDFLSFLSFPTREMAEEFLKCFRDLIKQAGDLI